LRISWIRDFFKIREEEKCCDKPFSMKLQNDILNPDKRGSFHCLLAGCSYIHEILSRKQIIKF